ncbi:3-methyl-2-oxobutanoate hydroxymethyltransferase [Bradyrhizobium sp. CCBAU 53380]|uniref:3-methyl-2-oxobutanoate hydroxymethyltransferase n=1 Tax=Bradyrhizobium sp. CCBAU 53380 TaxID=1325117 RepID=UPI003FA49AC0
MAHRRYASRQHGHDESSLEAASRTRARALVVANMPFLRFHLSLDETIRNTAGFLQRGAGAVKLEGGAKRVGIMRALVACEIPVMGHLGLPPHVMGGFKVQGRTRAEALRLLDDNCRPGGRLLRFDPRGHSGRLAERASDALTMPPHRNCSRAGLLRPGARIPRRLRAGRS